MKLHLACGETILGNGWTNVDIRECPCEKLDEESIYLVKDCTDLSWLENESVDEILVAHFLEHFRVADHHAILSSWWRVLKFGGRLRLVCPDFEYIVNIWCNNETRNWSNFSDSIFDIPSAPGTPGHRSVIDTKYLTYTLNESEFILDYVEQRNGCLYTVATKPTDFKYPKDRVALIEGEDPESDRVWA